MKSYILTNLYISTNILKLLQNYNAKLIIKENLINPSVSIDNHVVHRPVNNPHVFPGCVRPCWRTVAAYWHGVAIMKGQYFLCVFMLGT